MQQFSTVVIGGGASGIVAAISASRKGKAVLICERMPRLAKKVLASGSGRCNLLNEDLNEGYYNLNGRKLVKSVFSRFGKKDIQNFFNELGLETYSEGGRIFPITNQSASLLKVLEFELKRLAIPVEFNFEAEDILDSKEGFIVKSKDNKDISADSVIIAGGGRAYPSLGSDGSCYKLAQKFGHTIIEPVPSAVPLVVKDRLCHILQGQKIFANAKSIIDGKLTEGSGSFPTPHPEERSDEGSLKILQPFGLQDEPSGKNKKKNSPRAQLTNKAEGEVLFTKYGLSGTSILDISEDISIAINRHKKKDVSVSIDMAPFMDREILAKELEKRAKKGGYVEDLIVGILPNKFSAIMKDLCNKNDYAYIADSLKDKRFKVAGTRGWNEAEFTSGGIDINEVKESTLESRLKKNLYFSGEVLDIQGKRGGYNLAWAWASGFVAGDPSGSFS